VLQGSTQLHGAVLNVELFSWERVAGKRFGNDSEMDSVLVPHGVLKDIGRDDGARNQLKGQIQCPIDQFHVVRPGSH